MAYLTSVILQAFHKQTNTFTVDAFLVVALPTYWHWQPLVFLTQSDYCTLKSLCLRSFLFVSSVDVKGVRSGSIRLFLLGILILY